MKPIFRSHAGGSRSGQSGGFFLGLIVGLLIGLGVALAVAMYVTKVPVPFLNKVPQRSVEQDAAQAEKNRNWDPNAALSSKSSVRAPPAPGATPGTVTPAAPLPSSPAAAAKPTVAEASAPTRKDAKVVTGAVDKAAAPAEPLTYFVQAGAYARNEDAEQQRANLALMGFTPKVTEREQAGRTVYRVRVGPYERKEDADAAKEKLDAAGVESALVRVQR